MRRIRYLLVPAALILVSAAHAADQPPALSPAIRACVESNLPRYTTPDTAVLAQYISLVAACRAALAHENDVQVTLTPIHEPSAPNGAATTRAQDVTSTEQTATGSAPPLERTRAGTRSGEHKGSSAPGTATVETAALARVRESLAAPHDGAAAAPAFAGLTAAPGWRLVLAGALALAAISAGLVRAWRRPR